VPECPYCGCDAAAHDPVSVTEADGTARTFCNYGCLVAFVDREGLAVGATYTVA
jgi:hypothetical protein